MKKSALAFAAIVTAILVSALPSFGQWSFDFENGVALAGYNDVQIPRDAGTLFSLAEDLTIDPAYFFRLRLGYRWKDRHTLSIFAAPFRLRAAGTADRAIDFNGDTFAAGIPLTGVYKFNSYRLTYRYDLVRRGRWRVGLGLTAFIRDAAIKLEGGGESSTNSNVGFVPLLNFRVLWQFAEDWGVLFEGDAAAARQGRAEDVLLALQYRLSGRLALRAGYRILEGGADVEKVYNFALVHYLGAGVTYVF
jgi:signal transduction histidine kinase